MSGGWTLVDRNTNKSLPWTGSGSDESAYTTPSPGSQDAVGKMRVSQPQALIDTDFEYGQQPTKWESIGLQNGRQSMYYLPQQSAPVTAITGNGTRTVVVAMSNTSGFVVGSPIFVQNALDPNANGWFYVQTVNTNSNVFYQATAPVAAGNQFNQALTYVYPGYFYSGAGINLNSTGAFTYVGTTVSCTTTGAHGLDAGSFIYVRNITSTAGTQLGWISGTTMYFNVQPAAGLALRTGYLVTGAGVTANTVINTVNTAVSTGFISGTTLSVTADAAQVVGNQLLGTGVLANTHVTAVNTAAFTANVSGTTLTITAGTNPTIGMVLTGTANIPAGTFIASGTAPTFTMSVAGTTSTGNSVTGTSYTVSASQTVASTTITGYNYTVNNSQTVGSLGAPVLLTLSSTSVPDTGNGAYIVATVPTANTFTFTVPNAPFGTISVPVGNLSLYARPAGFVESRSFDGGVAFSAGAIAPNQQLIRQTRRYFRYQSGKGLQFSTGTSLKPALFVTSLTSSGTTATVTTRFAHNLGVGARIIVQGCDQGPYNGNFTVATTPTTTTFTYVMTSAAASPATGLPIRVSPDTWWGSSNRVGMMDLQNGLFFEYDGQELYAVWRNSIVQISGTVTVTNGSGSVVGTGTQFSSQLKPGDWIVIRGQSYRVLTITSDTALSINPEYRGSTLNQGGCLVSKTVDTRVPRSRWADPLDGTGPSGYTIDLTKMQMFYVEYSWYGAGFARWGLRTTNGQITYVYQQTNNNAQFEAYMRSGNMAAHYESNGTSPSTFLTSTLSSIGTVINVADTSSFAPSGTVKVSNPGATGIIEYMSYSAKTPTTLVLSARAQPGGSTPAQTFTYSATAPIQVEFVSPDTTAPLSHWGSSVIMDGSFDDDKSLVFNYGTTTAISLTAGTTVPILAIRIAPSVDNGTIGLLGAKEIINRAQLQLVDMAAVTSGAVLINLVLNGFCTGFSGSFVPVNIGTTTTSSLAQVAVNTSNTATITGGESVTALYANGVQQIDLAQVRDLGNSILGGGTVNTVPTSQAGMYPDGPDILYIVATNTTAAAVTMLARVNWKESQA